MRYFLLSILLINSILSFSQELLKQSVNIKQDGLSYKFYLLDQDEKGVRNYSDSKYYYWFKAQKVMSTQGGSSGSLLDGQFQSFYANNQLFEQGDFEKGLKSGEWKKWDNSGTLIRVENWKNGKLLGKQTDYNTAGAVTTLTLVKRRITVIEKADTTITIKGNYVKTVYRDSLGKTLAVSRTKNGLLHGKQEMAGSDGHWDSSEYKNGVPVKRKQKEKISTGDDNKTPLLKCIFKKKDNPEQKPKEKKEGPKTGKTGKKPFKFKKKSDD